MTAEQDRGAMHQQLSSGLGGVFDPLLSRDDLVIASHHDHALELMSVGGVHCAGRDAARLQLCALIEVAAVRAGDLHSRSRPFQLAVRPNDDA
jgi:hypothetical protein